MSKLNKLEVVMEQYQEGIINKKGLIDFVGDMTPVEIVDDIRNIKATDQIVADAEKDIVHSHYALVLATIEAMFKDIKAQRICNSVMNAHKDLMKLYDPTSHEGSRKAMSIILSLAEGIRVRWADDVERIERQNDGLEILESEIAALNKAVAKAHKSSVAAEIEKKHLEYMVNRLLSQKSCVMVCKNMTFDK